MCHRHLIAVFYQDLHAEMIFEWNQIPSCLIDLYPREFVSLISYIHRISWILSEFQNARLASAFQMANAPL